MGSVYAYEDHNGLVELMFLADHLLTDGERFCPSCEEWSELIGHVDTREELIAILNAHQIYEKEGYYTKTYEELMNEFETFRASDYVRPVTPKERLQVGVFFFVEGNFAVAACPLSEAEIYGDFLVYPKSHYDVWNAYRYLRFKNLKDEVDYDYYPRGGWYTERLTIRLLSIMTDASRRKFSEFRMPIRVIVISSLQMSIIAVTTVIRTISYKSPSESALTVDRMGRRLASCPSSEEKG